MTLYLPGLLNTALMNSYRPFPTWLIFRSVVVIFLTLEGGFSETKVKESQHGFDKENYRRVSNLAFLSEITEKAATLQISDHVSFNQMFPEFQSAYRKYHSTETALLRIRNDILPSVPRSKRCL